MKSFRHAATPTDTKRAAMQAQIPGRRPDSLDRVAIVGVAHMQQPIRSLEHGGVRILRTVGVRVARLRGQAGSFVRLTTWPRVPGGELLRGRRTCSG